MLVISSAVYYGIRFCTIKNKVYELHSSKNVRSDMSYDFLKAGTHVVVLLKNRIS